MKWFILIFCIIAFNVNSQGLLSPAIVANLHPTISSGGGVGNPSAPVYVSSISIVDVTTTFNTNTVDTTGIPNPIIISVMHKYGSSVVTNLCNGMPMTLLTVTNGYNNNANGFGIWYFIPPTNGIYQVACNVVFPIELSYISLCYSNVHQTIPFGSATTDFSTELRTGTTNVVSSATDNLIFDAIGWNSGVVGNVGANQTRKGLADPSANNASIATSEKSSEGASSTMRWSNFTSGEMVWIGAALKGP